jgi:hypothetical protein
MYLTQQFYLLPVVVFSYSYNILFLFWLMLMEFESPDYAPILSLNKPGQKLVRGQI